MTNATGKRFGAARRLGRTRPTLRARHAGQVERLESRELLSSFAPVDAKFLWGAAGPTSLAQVWVNASGDCVGVSGPQMFLHEDCLLGEGAGPNRVVVQFNANIDKRSFNAASDVVVGGDLDPSNPFRVFGGTARRGLLTLFTTGGFSADDGSEMTLTIQGISSKGRKRTPAVVMDPWTVTLQVTPDPPPPPPPVEVCGDNVDNDGDGQADEGCAPPPPPPVEVCGDNIDNDGDSRTDEDCVVTPPDPRPSVSPGDITPPLVVGVSPTVDAVIGTLPTTISVAFSEPVDPTTLSTSSIRLFTSGGDGRFGDRADRPIATSGVTYNAAGRTAVLQLAETLGDEVYQIQVGGAHSIKDLAGNTLDGDRNALVGGLFTSEFQIDRSTPSFDLSLAPVANTGISTDETTSRQDHIGVTGQVSDGSLSRLGGYQVAMDVDGDGFDDGGAITDANGYFTVTSLAQIATSGRHDIDVRVTDRAGNSSVRTTTINVDADAPLLMPINLAERPDPNDYRITPAGHVVRLFDESPTELRIAVSENLAPGPARDLDNYRLERTGQLGLFSSPTALDLSSQISEARFDETTRQIVVTLASALADGEYQLVVRSHGTITDVAGNHPVSDGILGFYVGAYPAVRAFTPAVTPMTPDNVRQMPTVRSSSIEYYGRDGGSRSEQSTSFGSRSAGLARLTVNESETFGNSTNNPFDPQMPGTAEPIAGTTFPFGNFGVDQGEDPEAFIFGDIDSGLDVDVYSFRAKAGESVRFTLTDQFGFFPFGGEIAIIDLGTDNAVGGAGDAADRTLISNVHKFIDPDFAFFQLLDLSQIEITITGLTGRALDNPENELLNPLTSERRDPSDRTYLLRVDPFIGSYVISAEMWESFSRDTNQSQIVYVDFDGQEDVSFPNYFTGGTLSVDMPPFDIRDFGIDPIFQNQFIDTVMAAVREDFEQIRAEGINPAYNFQLRDSLWHPDPGNANNVLRVVVGGAGDLIGFQPSFGLAGIADALDTGNRQGNNVVLVFPSGLIDVAQIFGVAPLGFTPAQLDEIALETAATVSHEAGHVLGQRHTNQGLFQVDLVNNVFGCDPLTLDNIADASPLGFGDDLLHRFDRYLNMDDLFCQGRIEDYDGVADSGGVIAWGMEGRDTTPPRVLDIDVLPGQIKIAFDEGVDAATLINPNNVRLFRDDGNNDFQNGGTPVQLRPVTERQLTTSQADPCDGPTQLGVSLYDACTTTLTLDVSDPVNEIHKDKKYRLVLSGITDNPLNPLNPTNPRPNALDCELNRKPFTGAYVFPTGNGTPGCGDDAVFPGDSTNVFQFDFLATETVFVDGDYSADNGASTGLFAAPHTLLPQALQVAEYAGFLQPLVGEPEPVTVRVAPSIAPYRAVDPQLDSSFNDQPDQGSLFVPPRVNLVFDGRTDIVQSIFVVAPDPAAPADNPGTIYRVDANSPAGGNAVVLDRFFTPRPIPGGAGLAFDGSSLFLTQDAPGDDAVCDEIFTLDPFTGATRSIVTPRTASATGAATCPADATNIDGLAAAETLLFGVDATDERVVLLDRSNGTLVGSFVASFDLAGGIDFDATTNTLWAAGVVTDVADPLVGRRVIRQMNPVTGEVRNTVPLPAGSPSAEGLGLSGDRIFFSDVAGRNILELNEADPSASRSFAFALGAPVALAGPPRELVVTKLLGTRIEAFGEDASLSAIGKSVDEPVVFTSLRDTAFMGTGVSSALAGDWMGLVYRPDSADVLTDRLTPEYASVLENVLVRFGGGPGTIIPPVDPASQDPVRKFGVVQSLSPLNLFDARIKVENVEFSNNAEAAIAVTPNALERIQGKSGFELFWDVEPGAPIVGNWCVDDPSTPAEIECEGVEFGLYEATRRRVLVDANGNRELDEAEQSTAALGETDSVPVVGNFTPDIEGRDELAVFNRATGVWIVDVDRSFSETGADLLIEFGKHGDIPIVGDWGGTGTDKLGLYRPRPRTTDTECQMAALLPAACFVLDLNNNFRFDAGEDFNLTFDPDQDRLFGARTDVPVVGDFCVDDPTTAPVECPGDEIGLYRGTSGDFLLDRNANFFFDPGEQDTNGDGVEDSSEVKGVPNGQIDINDGPIVFGPLGGTPVVGDWCVDDALTAAVECPGDEVGVVDSSLKWIVDANGNLKQDELEVLVQFGKAGDVVAPGNWRGTRVGDEFGVFRPVEGTWTIDLVTLDPTRAEDPSEDIDLDRRLDRKEDANGNNTLDPGEDRDLDKRLDLDEDIDPDGIGPLLANGRLDLNDGPFVFSAARRNDISDFVFENSLNSVWVRPGLQTVSDAHWDDTQIPHVLTGTVEIQALPLLGVVPTLQMKPGMVVKMGLANLNVGGFGATLLVDSDLEIDQPRVVFTSLLDDERGPGSRPNDTNNDKGSLTPLPGDWGGIVLSSGTTAVINGAEIQYGGNLRVPAGTSLISPSPITLNQATCNLTGFFVLATTCDPVFATITNNIIANTNNLRNTSSPRTLPSDVAAIGAVGVSLLGLGPNTPRIPFNANPFIRGNDVSQNNGLNGLEIRTSEFQDPATAPLTFAHAHLFSESRWDDTDITHILLGTLQFVSSAAQFPQPFDIPDQTSFTNIEGFGLTLASNPIGFFDEFDGTVDGAAESLVVKFGGRLSNRYSLAAAFPGTVIDNGSFVGFPRQIGAGFNVGFDDGGANTPFQNFPWDSGGDSFITVQGILGDPERGVPASPVILTSVRDDTTGPRGVQEDTNNDGATTAPARGDWEGIHVGAWSRNAGRISPINGAPLSASSIRNADIRYANTAVLLQSQSIELEGNLIRNSNIAIDSLQGPNIPDVPMGVNPPPIPRDPASPIVYNNLLIENGIGYRQTGGPDNGNPLQESFPSRAVFVNNTVDANDAGLVIAQRSGPLIMNNAITNTVGTGLNADSSSLRLNLEASLQHDPPIQIVRNLFFGNGANGSTGTVPATVGGQEIVGLAPNYTSPGSPDYNYRPAPGSPLVDSALSEYGDVFGVYGLVEAPDRDRNGLFRRDHFGTPNVGVGQRPWLDIGGAELVDLRTALPRVVRMNPVPDTNFDNGQGPGLVELEFSEPVTGVGATTIFVESSGGDGSFLEGNEQRLVGVVSASPGSNNTRWVFTPSGGSSFNDFQNEIFQVTAVGSGPNPVKSIASDDALDGEFNGAFPSGDGIEGGDFEATFTIGEVVLNAIYVDDTSPPCNSVPRNDPNLVLVNSIQAALAQAGAGSTILVCPGVYTAPLQVTFPVTIESLEGALPRKNPDGSIIQGTGTFITVNGGTAVQFLNVSGQTTARLGRTRGGANRGFVISTAPTSGSPNIQPSGIGIDVQASTVEIEGNVIVATTIGINVDSQGTNRMPNISNNLIAGNTSAGIDVIGRSRDAVANIVNNTIAFNNNGILVRDDGVEAAGRVVANVYNNIVTSNTLAGISQLVKSRPLIKHNNVWGNDQNRANFSGSLTNLPPSSFDPAGNPVPDSACGPTSTKCGNISVNPLFVRPVDPGSVSDRADFLRLGNFTLQSASKLIDRALDEVAVIRDFNGVTRTVDVPDVGIPETDPEASPRSVDIGAFEFVPSSVAGRTAERSRTAATPKAATSRIHPRERDLLEFDLHRVGVGAEVSDYLLQQVGTLASDLERFSDEWTALIDSWLDDEGRELHTP